MERKEELELITAWQDGQDYAARNKLVMAHDKWVRVLAHRWAKRDKIKREDLYQEGIIGVMRAADLFDRNSKYKFMTYASIRATSKITEYIRRTWGVCRVASRHPSHSKAFFSLNELHNPDSHRDLQKVANKYNIDIQYYIEVLACTNTPGNLQSSDSDHYDCKASTISDPLVFWLADEAVHARLEERWVLYKDRTEELLKSVGAL